MASTTIVFQINQRLSCETIDNNKIISLQANHDLKAEDAGVDAIAKYHSLLQAVIRFLGTAEGIYRSSRLWTQTATLATAVRLSLNMGDSPFLKKLEAQGDVPLLALIRLPSITEDAVKAVKDVHDSAAKSGTPDALSPEQMKHKVVKATHDVLGWASTVGYSAATVIELIPSVERHTPRILGVAGAITLGADVSSAQMNAANLSRAQAMAKAAHVQGASKELVDTIQQTKKYNMLGLVKDICSIAGGIFGVVLFATGIAVVPGIVLVTVALASTIFAVTKNLYKESMRWKPIDFLDPKHVSRSFSQQNALV